MSTFTPRAVTCEACGTPYVVARYRASRRNRRLCVSCRGRAGQAQAMAGFGTPDSTKAERLRANGLINMRLRRGKMRKPKRCGWCKRKVRLDSHHPDYRRPAIVLWLCRSCHQRTHRGHAGPDPVNLAAGRGEIEQERLARTTRRGGRR